MSRQLLFYSQIKNWITMIVKDLQMFSDLTTLYIDDRIELESINEVAVSELMSDVLTMEHDNLLLVTGLCTDQAIRTADIMGAVAVVVTQNKRVTGSMLAIAKDSGMGLFATDLQNFDMCQKLCETGEFSK